MFADDPGSSPEGRASADDLLRVSTDALLDPLVLLEAARDSSGQIVDFLYRSVNQATCDYLGLSSEDLHGRGLVETTPGIKDTLLAGYIRCLTTGEPLVLNDFSYDNEILADSRIYDLRASRAKPNFLVLTWRDVTDRFQLAKRAAESEVRYRRSMDNSAVGLCLTTPDGHFIDVNNAMCQFFGYDAAALTQMTWQELTAPEYLDADVANVAKILSGQMDSYRLTKQFIHAEGRRIWGDLSVSCLRTPDGDVESLIAQITDVTKEMALTKKLALQTELVAAAEERYRRSINNAAVGMCLVTPQGRIYDVNEAICSFFGYDAEAMNGTRWQDFTAPEYLEEELNKFNGILEGRRDSYQMTKHYVHADGHRIWGELSVSAVRDDQGRVSNFIALISDVTDRVDADERNRVLTQQLQQEKGQIAASEVKYRLLAENATDIVCHVRDANLVWVSPSIEKVLGAPPDHWLGQEIFAHVPPEDIAEQVALLATVVGGGAIKHRGRVIGADGVAHWFDLRAQPFIDVDGRPDGVAATLRLVDDEVAAEKIATAQRRAQARSDALYRRSVDGAAVGMCLINAEGGFVEVNDALCKFFGFDAEALKSKTWQELTAAEYLKADLDNVADVLAGRVDSYRITKGYIHADGHPIWGDLSVSCLRDDKGQVEVFISQITDLTGEVETRKELDRVRREQQKIDERYRLAMNNAAVGMCMSTPEGRPLEVNEALCRFLGYDAQTLIGMDWRNLTQPEDVKEEEDKHNALLEGRIDFYRIAKHYIRTDGKSIWGDLSVTALRGKDGHVKNIFALVTDITAQVLALESNQKLTQRLQQQKDTLTTELESAANYMASVMPTSLEGPVTVSSLYLPSQELGGDCLDYYWIDDDHLLIKLIDVSGHGVEPALLAVSVHNLMRSGSLPVETLLSPEAVLTELNRLFAMDQQNDHYFTMWYGIYEASTRTLRYASAGAPPALALSSATGTAATSTALSTTAAPIGMFTDTEFTSDTYHVPAGCRVLIYSDGASELTLADGQQLTGAAFTDLASRVAASPDWSLDDLLDELRTVTSSDAFEDDLSLIQVQFD